MWSTERTELLTRLWHEGYSARVIAEKLGGVTRNAVIGKSTRLGLERRGPDFVPVPAPPKPAPIAAPKYFNPERAAEHKAVWQCRVAGCVRTKQPADLRGRCAECITAEANERLRITRGTNVG